MLTAPAHTIVVGSNPPAAGGLLALDAAAERRPGVPPGSVSVAPDWPARCSPHHLLAGDATAVVSVAPVYRA